MSEIMGPKFTAAVFGVIAFLVLVVSIGLTAQVLSAMQGTQGSTVTNTATNETFGAAINGTLRYAGTPGNLNNIINTSGDVVQNSTHLFTRNVNYTLTTNGRFNLTPSATVPSTTRVNITNSYTVFIENAEYNVSGSGVSGMTNVSDFIPTMGLIFGIIVLIGLLVVLVMMFAGGRLG